MTLTKAFIATFLFYIIVELTDLWVLVDIIFDISFLLEKSKFISALIELFLILIFINQVQGITSALAQKTEVKFYFFGLLLGITFPFFQNILNIPYYWSFDTFFAEINWNFKNITNLNVIASFLIIPFCEELFFRQYIQNKLQQKFSPNTSILASSILFSLAHLPIIFLIFYDGIPSFHQSYITFFGGLLLGILYNKSKSIWPPIILHSAWNLVIHIS